MLSTVAEELGDLLELGLSAQAPGYARAVGVSLFSHRQEPGCIPKCAASVIREHCDDGVAQVAVGGCLDVTV
jgi:hypothetical protein